MTVSSAASSATPQRIVPKRTRVLKQILSLDDFESFARRLLPRPIYGFVSGGTEDGVSLANNRDAFRHWGFIPSVLRDTSRRTQSVTLFNQTYASPFGIAPMGATALVAYRGDHALAEAAGAAKIPMIISGSGLTRLEDIAKVNPHAWFQAYVPGEPQRIDALLGRVEASGLRTLVVTVDTTVSANRENNIRNGYSTPLRPSARLFWDGAVCPRWTLGTFLATLVRHGMPHFENSYATRGAPILSRSIERDRGARDHLNWTHLEQMRRRWKGDLVVKGIMSGADAAKAAGMGADGIIVSNHGGRQLDGTVAPLDALGSVRDAAPGITIMVDGGIRRGTDVVKAFALGAEFVFVGRPFLYAAAIGGTDGVRHAIEILSSEVHRDLGLLGLTGMDEVTPDILSRFGGPVHQQVAAPASVRGAGKHK